MSAQPTLKRRGRGRKAGNIGDRALDPARPIIDPNTGLMTTAAGLGIPMRKPRGMRYFIAKAEKIISLTR